MYYTLVDEQLNLLASFDDAYELCNALAVEKARRGEDAIDDAFVLAYLESGVPFGEALNASDVLEAGPEHIDLLLGVTLVHMSATASVGVVTNAAEATITWKIDESWPAGFDRPESGPNFVPATR